MPTKAYGFNTLFVQYYSVICRPFRPHSGEDPAPGRDSNQGQYEYLFRLNRKSVRTCFTYKTDVFWILVQR